MNAKELVYHPLTALAVVGSTLLAIVPGLAPLWEFLGATSGTWFPLATATGGIVLPNLGLPDLGTQLLLAGGLVYVAVYADRLIDRTRDYLRNS